MELKLDQIAGMINARIIGDPGVCVYDVNSFDKARNSDITFAHESKYLKRLSETDACAIIVPDSQEIDYTKFSSINLLTVKNPKLAFFNIVKFFYPEKKIKTEISSGAIIGKLFQVGKNPVIAPNVFIGDNVTIGDNVLLMPGVYIGDEVTIGNNAVIKPNVTIMERTQIGDNSIIHSGSVIGSDGYGFVQDAGVHEKIPHAGYVSILNNVEIGANTTIDRGTLGRTLIGNGVKVDNLVHIAHNVEIGDNSLIVGQVGIAGSAIIGKNVIIAGKAGISGHIKIGDNTIVGPFSGVHSNVGENQIVSGMPHMPHNIWRKAVTIISRLPEMRKKLFSMEKRLKNIEDKKK